ncbi:MAG: cation-translocating P-type ATPase C-terminal domain-containing protein [Gammaproteobacteria bacterium]
MVTDGLPGLALAAEAAERGVMTRPPRPPSESLFAHGLWQHILWCGLLIGSLALLPEFWLGARSTTHWQSMVFTTLAFTQLAHVLAIRSERDSLIIVGLRSNPWLLVAVLLTVALQLAVLYVPFLQVLFHSAPLTAAELAVCLGLAVVVWIAVELEKALVRRGWLYRTAAVR